MQERTDPWQAAGFLGMSVQVLIDTYGHHHPDHMRDAAEAITSKTRFQLEAKGLGSRKDRPAKIA